MKRIEAYYRKLTIVLFSILTVTYCTPLFSQESSLLKLDPELLILLKESQNVTNQLSDQLYPNWKFSKTPVLFYKPNVQDILINFPHKPEGFDVYNGFNPLDGQTIYVRNESTYIQYDDQNTTIEIDGVKVLVVADTYSSMRNQLRGAIMNQPKEFLNKWLDDWSFIGSPYHKLSTILHEGFHVHQETLAKGKNANEGSVANYPFLDPINNSLSVLEGLILKDALLSKDEKIISKKARQFVAVRNYRQSLLDSVFVAYENLNEFAEGTAKYIEYKFYSEGENITPIDEMKYINGFADYKNTLPDFFKKEIEDMVNIVSVNDNRFGNKFGAGPLRFKLYYLGACQGLLLDKVMPKWKSRIFDKEVFLSGLLDESLSLSSNQKKAYLDKAKLEYDYDGIFKTKLEFEKEGKKVIQEKVDAIMSAPNKTLVILDYKGHKITGMNYTPFGVTKVDDNSIIYEMVPVGIYFDKVPELISKTPFPLLVNTKEERVYFSINTSIDEFTNGTTNKMLYKEFEVKATEFNVKKENNAVIITFK
ncbi:hypothetical protein [Pontimicrobium aquaticum]|uniref:Uncharacterized protein n=1 Tax=Pontimicrobium aquaticum TaxID=2565367 RepID=A0A4U0F0A7_9FLAO|nr:hypothetical protein [Pontimicrobium aquaticum]TJY37773.1 hypothetical protein E5167_00535 [Pontimicrobium aquaticum]